jgi:hypothetical protein
MKTMAKLMVLLAAAVLAVSANAAVTDFNLATYATGFGIQSNAPLTQGAASGVADRLQWQDWSAGWNAIPFNSPTVTNSTGKLGVYMTWSSDTAVRTVRVLRDISHTYDEIYVDTLNAGGNATNDADWTVRSSNTGLANVPYYNIELANSYTTRGVRVRVHNTASDINRTSIGEIAVYSTLGLAGTGTINTLRVAPSSVTASSVSLWGTPASFANDTNWTTRWLSAVPTSNPGTDYTYSMNFSSGKSIGGVQMIINQQLGFAEYPSTWELLVDQGSGLSNILTVAKPTTSYRELHCYDFGQIYTGVTQLQFRCAESAVTNGVGLIEFEALYIPEPGSLLLLLGAGALLALRRRR